MAWQRCRPLHLDAKTMQLDETVQLDVPLPAKNSPLPLVEALVCYVGRQFSLDRI